MATALSKGTVDRDAQVLDSINRLGLGIRELLRVALGGVDPNNILQRLLARRVVRSVSGLPQNRSYYVPSTEKPLGAQALQQRLAVAWHVLMNQGAPCVALTSPELIELFGLQAPTGTHVLEAGAKPRVLQVYAPETVEVAPGILRHVERAKSFPKVQKAIDDGDYGFLVLVPWTSGLETKIQAAFSAPDLTGVDASFIAQAKKFRAIAPQAAFQVARVATPETLTLALKEAAGGTKKR